MDEGESKPLGLVLLNAIIARAEAACEKYRVAATSGPVGPITLRTRKAACRGGGDVGGSRRRGPQRPAPNEWEATAVPRLATIALAIDGILASLQGINHRSRSPTPI